MNLLQIRTLLRSRIGSPSTTDVPDANLNGHINRAITEITDRYRFLKGRGRAKFSTVIAVDKYHIDSIADAVFKVWDRTNNKRLTKAGPRYVADTEWNGETTQVQGKPEKYARFQGYIQLIPIPDGVYEIEFFYRSYPAVLAVDGDVPELPPSWHRGIAVYATYLYYVDEGKDQKKGTMALNEFATWSLTKTVEVDEESVDIDAGVELPTLGNASDRRLDFDHGP